MTAATPALTAWDHVKFAGVLCQTLTTLFTSVLTAGFRGESGASTYKRHVIYRTFRTFTRSNTTKQAQAAAGTSIDVYNAFVTKNGLKSEVVDLSDNTRGAWLGDKTADTIILWLHGGGYALPLGAGHLQLIHELMLAGRAKDCNVSCFFLEYDLAPQGVYPRQLTQAAAALRYLTTTAGIPPSRIILAGDSAGGNLSLGLLSHLLHPHPSIAPISLATPLKGVVLVSPWVTFDQSAAAMKANAYKDMLDGPVLKRWSDAFMGKAEVDNYNTPLAAGGEWWRSLPVGEVLVLAGTDEVFVGDVEAFVGHLKVHNGDKMTVVVAEGEAHDMPVLDYLLGFEPGKQTQEFHKWMLERA